MIIAYEWCNDSWSRGRDSDLDESDNYQIVITMNAPNREELDLINRVLIVEQSKPIPSKYYVVLCSNHGELVAYDSNNIHKTISDVMKLHEDMRLLDVQPCSDINSARALRNSIITVTKLRQKYGLSTQTAIAVTTPATQ